MFKKKYLVAFFILQLVLLLGLSSTSLGYTINDFWAYTDQIIDDSSVNSIVRTIATGIKNNKSAFLSKIPANILAQATSFYAAANNQTNANNGYVMFYLGSGNKTINIASGKLLMESNLGWAYKASNGTNWVTTNPNDRYYSNYCYGLVDTTSTFPSGWVFNGYNPLQALEFQQNFTNTTTYQGYSTHYTIGSPYIVNSVKIGSVVPNDAVYYEVRMIDKDTGINIGSYYNNLTNGDTYPNNALYGNVNDIYLYTRYITYNHVYDIEITYIYEINGEEQYNHNYLVFFPQRKCS